MSDSPYPSQNQDKFVLRLPDGMRDRIKDAANRRNRSMNAEIVATLEKEYPEPTDTLAGVIDDIRALLDQYETEKDPKKRISLQKDIAAMAAGHLWLF